jgi:hypothetical protein
LTSDVRKLKIAFVNENGSTLASLLEEDAPNTSEAIWQMLPIKTKAIHDIWSGHVLFFHLEPMVKLPAENLLTYLPKAGDIFYYYRPPHYFRGAPYGRVEDAEVGIVYARDSRPQGPRGPKSVNVFSSVLESDLPKFEKMCERVLYEGSKEIEITRA